MSTYENEPIPRNGGAIRLDDLGWLRPQEISQPTIHGTGMNTKITSTYHVMCIIFWLGIYPTHLIASSDREFYIQNTAKDMWSQGDIWHVPPLPGPSHG